MPKQKVTKTLSLDRTVIQTIEKIAQQERRSFTKQVEIMLEHALERQKCQPTAAAL
jgi:hypothetical protein